MTIHPRTEEAYNLLHNGILSFARAELQGIRIDVDYCEQKKEYLTKKIKHLEGKFKLTKFFRDWQDSVQSPVNIDSDVQLRNFLYGVKKLKPKKFTDSGQGSTDAEALQQLKIPELEILAQRDKLKRLRDVNLDGFVREQVNGYMHPFFNLHLASSFRSSSNSPNFQNIPVKDEESMLICRKALYPRPGHLFLEADFKAIEVGINACYNKDSNLLKYVRDPNSDMHRDMAKQIFMIDKFDRSLPSNEVLRQAVKNGFVFPEFYGDYYKNCAVNVACNWGKLSQGKWHTGEGIKLDEAFTLGDHLISKGINSLTRFEAHLQKIEKDLWENRFPEYDEWRERWWSIYKKHGYFDTLTGFRCGSVMQKNQVISIPAQGTAFHCLLFSFIEIDKVMLKEKWDTKIVAQIHDNIIFDTHPDELSHVAKIVQNVTTKLLPESWEWIIVPMQIKMSISPVNGSWSEKQNYEV
jgi:DNA polymerase I